MIFDEVLRSTIEQSWWNETQSYWVYTWLDTSGPESVFYRFSIGLPWPKADSNQQAYNSASCDDEERVIFSFKL